MMDSTCKHCQKPITMFGMVWRHTQTDKRRCEEPPLAEPPDMDHLAAAEASGYERGFNAARKTTYRKE